MTSKQGGGGNGLGRHQYFPWVRRGASADIDSSKVENADGSVGSRAAIQVGINLNKSFGGAAAGTSTAAIAAQLYGPGDVIGIDPRHIVRTEPRHLTANFEPNYFAGIEFDHPEFPWMITPAAPAGDNLRPWLVLICLKSSEFTASTSAPKPLPQIEILDMRALPDLRQSHLWAHAQVAGEIPSGDLAKLIATQPAMVLSRLICPRHLEPETAYTAFLVPAYDLGVQVGLGNDVSKETVARPAWDATTTKLNLPVYFSFEFHTSDQGDFESLVRQLKPRVLDKLGLRALDVDHAGWGLPKAGQTLDLGGALQSVGTKPRTWTGTAADNYRNSLVGLINMSTPATVDSAQDPVVAPPIYGRWHASYPRVDSGAPSWMRSLNSNPPDRSVAGVGTSVVLQERSQLLASAWQQVAGVLAANEILRRAQVARAALAQLHANKLKTAAPETALLITSALHSRIKTAATTASAQLIASPIPIRATSAAFRRVIRPSGLIRRRQAAVARGAGPVVARINRGELISVRSVNTPGALVTMDSIGQAPATRAVRLMPTRTLSVQSGQISPTSIVAVPARANFRVTSIGQAQPASDSKITGTTDSTDAAAFRTASANLATMVQAPLTRPTPTPPAQANIPGLSSAVLGKLDPAATVHARVGAMIQVGPATTWPRPNQDNLAPITAAPTFPQPMYQALRDLSAEYVLPGLETVPPETMSVLESNHRFIEAYMVGLNHEMARQLLWHDYPTDQRGSYFRQFWDVSAYVPRPTDPPDVTDALKDIPPIHLWPPGNDLGQNENRGDVANNVVLIVRGELLRRYPNTVIYACNAALDGKGKRVLGQTELHHLFRGTLDPDVTFFGFSLTPDEAKGSHDPNQPQGYFFVFQQQPTEPRFGLEPVANDPVTDWNDLSWLDFTLPSDPTVPFFAPASTPPQNVTAPLKASAWGSDSATMATITLRRPVRICVHAEMMLP